MTPAAPAVPAPGARVRTGLGRGPVANRGLAANGGPVANRGRAPANLDALQRRLPEAVAKAR